MGSITTRAGPAATSAVLLKMDTVGMAWRPEVVVVMFLTEVASPDGNPVTGFALGNFSLPNCFDNLEQLDEFSTADPFN